jgi:hypothetical protein
MVFFSLSWFGVFLVPTQNRIARGRGLRPRATKNPARCSGRVQAQFWIVRES